MAKAIPPTIRKLGKPVVCLWLRRVKQPAPKGLKSYMLDILTWSQQKIIKKQKLPKKIM